MFVNNELSDSGLVKAGEPQGSVLDPLLYLLYINDITDNLGNLARMFADDTSLSYSGKNFDLMQKIKQRNTKKKEKTKRRAYQCPPPFIMEYLY